VLGLETTSGLQKQQTKPSFCTVNVVVEYCYLHAVQTHFFLLLFMCDSVPHGGSSDLVVLCMHCVHCVCVYSRERFCVLTVLLLKRG